ncbi:MAG: Txe/YoeB family addiction module toxin [Fretibacterium sp.]|nr:Txe/YoeB family addiction module toxin [Fretibacterium sp.]
MGPGRPEPLKHELSGFWSRHITQEHRLIYCVDKEQLLIIACRYHYDSSF